MKATLVFEDGKENLRISLEFSEEVDDNTRSNAVDAALFAMQAVTDAMGKP